MSKVVGVVLPGTYITSLVEALLAEDERRKEGQLPVLKLGTGLIYSGEEVLAVQAGLLHYLKPNKFWIEGRQKRYVPATNDLVLGIISARLGEAYKVDLGSSTPGTLPHTGFEGTTKKNRPNLAIGDVVFARVSVANKDLEPELVCLDGENRAEGFGEVKEGMLFRCSCDLARSLQMMDNWVLEILGKHCAFEIIVGVNGRFVIAAAKPRDTIALGNIILESPGKDAKWVHQQVRAMSQSS